MAVAIDGEIFQDAYVAPLGPGSEIVRIPKIGLNLRRTLAGGLCGQRRRRVCDRFQPAQD